MYTPILDPNSYHVFKFMDKAILYDPGTDTICKINDSLSFDILELAGKYDIVDLREQLKENHGAIDDKQIINVIRPLKESGFFTTTPVNLIRVRKIKQELMSYTPSRLELCIMQGCNLACVYCYAEDCGSNTRNQAMSFNTAKQAVDYLVRASGSKKNLSIHFFGGEPLLNYELMKEVISYAKSLVQKTGKTFSFELTTNCTMLPEDVQDFLVENCSWLLLSIDGDEETHNQQRPFKDGSCSYNQVLNNALALNRKFLAHGHGSIRVRANIIGDNVKRLSKITEILSAMGFKVIDVAPIISRPGEKSPLALDENAWGKWWKQSDDQALHWLKSTQRNEKVENIYIVQYVKKIFELLKSRKLFGGIRCGVVGRNANTVDVDGNIYPCHRYPGLDEYIIGNIYTGLDRDKLSHYYDNLMNNMLKNCATCWLRFKCGGPCPWQVSSNDGNICPPGKFLCDDRKHEFEQAAYLQICLLQNK